MLKERVATAVVLLLVFLLALFLFPTGWFAVPVGAVVAAGAYEWAALAKTSKRTGYAYSAACAAVFAIVVWGGQVVDPAHPGLVVVFAVASLFWILVVPVWLFSGARLQSKALALAVGAIVIVPAGFSMVSLHFVAPLGLLMLLAFIWIADCAAYFAGRAFGKHKLAPAISPGKTWEGVAGAVAGTMIYAMICAEFSAPLGAAVRGYWPAYLGIALLLCAVSVVGDLFESLIKRQAKVKDSGTLLPGHGGVLDRIDSITSTLPVALLIGALGMRIS